MALYMVCNVFLFFLNSPSELTFWISLVDISVIPRSEVLAELLMKNSGFWNDNVMSSGKYLPIYWRLLCQSIGNYLLADMGLQP